MIVAKMRLEYSGADWVEHEAELETMSLPELLYRVLIAEDKLRGSLNEPALSRQ